MRAKRTMMHVNAFIRVQRSIVTLFALFVMPSEQAQWKQGVPCHVSRSTSTLSEDSMTWKAVP